MAEAYNQSIVMEWPPAVTAELLGELPEALGPAQLGDIEASARRSLHKRSISCSALADGVIYAAQLGTADDFSIHSEESNISVASTTACSTPPPAETTVEAEAEPLHHHHHRHRHKHKHKQEYRVSAMSCNDRSRSCSADDLPSTRAMFYGSDPRLLALMEDRRPRSFSAPTRTQPAHHVKFNSAPGMDARTAAAAGIPRTSNKSPCRHTNMSQANMPLAHVIVAGRRSPCHLGGGGGGGGHKQQGFSSGVAVGGYAVAGLGMPLVPKPDRIIAEWHKPEHIAKGFAAHWFSRRMLDVFTGSSATAPAQQLLGQVPAYAGLHLWVVRPPRGRQWVPVHLGSADNLQKYLQQYIHRDGSCGPAGEPFKHKVMLDLMCRGFAVQVRFRPVKHGSATAKADELTKLRLFDFPLNDRDNGGCRPIELPNGWQVVEYPVTNEQTNELFEGLFGPRRRS